MSRQTVAVAVIRDDPPAMLVAADLDILHRALAVRLVARLDPAGLLTEHTGTLRDALLNERWSDAVAQWIEITGVAVDVYTEDVLTGDDLPEDLLGLQMQLAPLFADA
jgi:hypothetical protein